MVFGRLKINDFMFKISNRSPRKYRTLRLMYTVKRSWTNFSRTVVATTLMLPAATVFSFSTAPHRFQRQALLIWFPVETAMWIRKWKALTSWPYWTLKIRHLSYRPVWRWHFLLCSFIPLLIGFTRSINPLALVNRFNAWRRVCTIRLKIEYVNLVFKKLQRCATNWGFSWTGNTSPVSSCLKHMRKHLLVLVRRGWPYFQTNKPGLFNKLYHIHYIILCSWWTVLFCIMVRGLIFKILWSEHL